LEHIKGHQSFFFFFFLAEGAARYKGERRNPTPLVGLGTARQARGFRRVSEGFGGFGFSLCPGRAPRSDNIIRSGNMAAVFIFH
jgi:hypothetical protein